MMRKKRLFGDAVPSAGTGGVSPSCWLKNKTVGGKNGSSKSGVPKPAAVVMYDNSKALKQLDMMINQAQVQLVE